MLPLIVAEIYTGTVQGSPSSVVGLKSRGCRNLKRGETRVPIVCYCMLLYVDEPTRNATFAAATAGVIVPLPFCADAFKIQRKRRLKSSRFCFLGRHTHAEPPFVAVPKGKT